MVTPAGQRALAHVAARAEGPPLEPRLAVTVHFHPDRLVGGVPLLHHLVADGVYRSQFETGTSNGGLTAFPGGERWRWEHRIFGGAYDDAPSSDRPKYGSLNHRRHPAGGSVRFGSSHFRLSGSVLSRVTFCHPDSSTSPTRFGTVDHCGLVEVAAAGDLEALDDHVEAHVHGPLRLDRDVDLLVLDPSFRETSLARAVEGFPFPTEYHQGFRLHVDVLAEHTEFRGPDLVEVGHRIAQDGWLTARIVGDAARRGEHDPQQLKRVWHCVARFGHDWTIS